MTANEPFQAHQGQVLLNRFQLSHPLGQGGMGEVWRAYDRDLGLDIALKLLHPELAAAPAQVEFLKNECRLARSLNHPHIVPMYDFHHDHETVFISMAWVDGSSFDHWRNVHQRPWADRLQPLVTIARALDYVHQQGLVHRDVKAGNILIDQHNRPHLTDFGIAGIFRIDADRSTGHSGGSRHCMSPQQRQGHPPHPADDIYSFGILLLETLTRTDHMGSDPLTADDIRRKFEASAHTPPDLIDLVVRMLATRREDRPPSLTTVAAAMEQALAERAGRTIPPGDTATPPGDAPAASSTEVITPQPFAASENRGEPGATTPAWRMPVFLGMVALLLMAGGGLLLQYLARHPLVSKPAAVSSPAPPDTPSEQSSPQSPPPVQALAPAEQPPAVDEHMAEQALADWRQALSELEAVGGPAWAPEAVAEVAREAALADDAFLQADYAGAAQHYTVAAENARQLTVQAPEVLAQLLAEGQTALEQGDGPRSSERFALALKIDPQNQSARKGLARAQKVAEVIALMQTGEINEADGNLALALADYEAALGLDPEWAPARAAVPRVRNQIAKTQFDHHMSAGLTAFNRKAYAQARREINKALAFKPGAPEAFDALNQIDTGARNDRMAQLRQQAQTAETKETWQQALEHYRQVLSIDQTIQFATRGAARAEERLRLEKRVQYYMDHPDDLAKTAYRAKATQLVAELRQVTPQGPRLKSQIATLDRMVQNAQTTVEVTLTSDELTEVTIYRIGRLGQFLSRTVELHPGTYTIAGARDGYKDVRHTLRIRPGQGPTKVVVQCTEKI